MKTSTLSPYRWTILIIVCAICFMANFMQYQVSAWGVTVMDMMQTDVAGLTNLMLMPMLTAVFLSIPSGSLADKFGVKRVVSVALVVSVAVHRPQSPCASCRRDECHLVQFRSNWSTGSPWPGRTVVATLQRRNQGPYVYRR